MSDIKQYFDEEMRGLQRQARDFAAEYPEAARRLSLDESGDHDPYVERLLEGVAFLTARIRQTLDLEEDGLAGHLLELVAPGVEIPLPATALVEFQPTAEMNASVQIRRGAQVISSRGAGVEPMCFAVSRDLEVHPLAIRNVEFGEGSDGAWIDLALEYVGRTSGAALPDPLPIHLHGDPALAWTLRHWLLRRSVGVEATVDGSPVSLEVVAPDPMPGCAFPASDSAAPLLAMRDFLCVEDRFRGIELRGLASLGLVVSGALVRIRFRFREPFPRALEREVGPSLFRLHTVAVVNAFLDDCQPVQMDLTRVEYPLQCSSDMRREILDVREVVGIGRNDLSRRRDYRAFASYRHLGRKGNDSGYYELVRREARGGGVATSISVGCADGQVPLEEEYLAVRAQCCDGERPRECLQPTDLSELGEGIPGGVAVRGITRPTGMFRPPEGTARRWSLLGHFHRSLKGLLELEVLKRTLELLSWDGKEHRRRMIDSLHSLECSLEHRLVAGVFFPQLRVKVVVRDEQASATSWERLGQLDAFGQMLHTMLFQEAPLGTRLGLSMEILPAGLVLEHPARG